jgi:hypothetical protein
VLDIKKEIKKLCIDNNISIPLVLEKYNKVYDKKIFNQSFYRGLTNINKKIDFINDFLGIIGYELKIVKKED